jgi:hypothetical protein
MRVLPMLPDLSWPSRGPNRCGSRKFVGQGIVSNLVNLRMRLMRHTWSAHAEARWSFETR